LQFEHQQGKTGGILQLLLLLLLPAAEHVQLGRGGVWVSKPCLQTSQPGFIHIPVCLHLTQADAALGFCRFQRQS
jgi:hypothetical protein